MTYKEPQVDKETAAELEVTIMPFSKSFTLNPSRAFMKPLMLMRRM